MSATKRWSLLISVFIIGIIIGSVITYAIVPKALPSGGPTAPPSGGPEVIPEKYKSIIEKLPDYYPKDYWKTIQAAEKEGSVTVYSIMSVKSWKPVIDDFNKLYPFIKVTTLDLGSYEVFDRYLSEVAGGAPSADIIISTAPDVFPDFIKKNAMKYVSPEAQYYQTKFILNWKLYIFDATPSLMVYNKKLLPKDKVPDSYQQLAEFIKSDPSFWSGKVTTYDIKKSAFGFNMVYFFTKKYDGAAWEWFTDIGSAHPVTYASSGTMLEKIATGEHLIGFFISRMSLFVRLEKYPGLYGVIYPKEGIVCALRAAMITAKAPHPNAAKLLLDFILSKQGQIDWAKGGLTPVRPDVYGVAEWSLGDVIKEVGEDKVILWSFSPELTNTTLVEQFKDKYISVISGGG